MTYKDLVRNFVMGIRNRFYSELKGDTFGVTEEALMPYGYPEAKEPLNNATYQIDDDTKVMYTKVMYKLKPSVSSFDDTISHELTLLYKLQKTMFFPVFSASYVTNGTNTMHYNVHKNTFVAVDRRAKQVNSERAKQELGKDLEGLIDL